MVRPFCIILKVKWDLNNCNNISRCDASDGRATAFYLADLTSNLAISGSIFDPLLSVTLIDGYVGNNK